jgi:threonine dehydratase
VTSDVVRRTPLVRLAIDGPAEIWLKLECLHPIGSFKIRGASSAIFQAPREQWEQGIWTTSAGNMAQGVAWMARELGVAASVVAPDHAPRAKLDAIARLGATAITVPFDTWWEAMETGTYPGLEGLFIHPVQDGRVIAGNGVIGLELAEELEEIDLVLVPFGGGGLSTGIASALAGLGSSARVVAVEPDTGAPLTASFAAGEPTAVAYTPSFVDGSGSKAVLPGMWEPVRAVVADAVSVSLDETAAAVRLLATRAHVVAEGAGALALAAALSGRFEEKRIVCIVSGGNIDAAVLAEILEGTTPR